MNFIWFFLVPRMITTMVPDHSRPNIKNESKISLPSTLGTKHIQMLFAVFVFSSILFHCNSLATGLQVNQVNTQRGRSCLTESICLHFISISNLTLFLICCLSRQDFKWVGPLHWLDGPTQFECTGHEWTSCINSVQKSVEYRKVWDRDISVA